MATKIKFNTAEELCDFIEKNCTDSDKMYVKEIYNVGDTQLSESPLFIYSGYSIIMVYLSEGTLFLNIYEKDFFIRNIRGGVFREEPDSENFYYVYFPDSKLIGSFIQNIDVKENEDGTVGKVELIFKDGRRLHIEHSGSVNGTMNSYITD